MKYRHAMLLYPQDLTNGSGTTIVDVDVNRPISRIEIRFKTTKVLSHMTAPGPANIPKIELVDGSKVLHGLTGYENQALAYYSRPNISMEHGQHIVTLSEVDLYTIDFGRYLWDEQLAFDPLRFHNPQLKITYDENVADTSATVNEMEIWADIFDEKEISPIGFLMAIEHYAYTPGASGSFELISLPADRPIRQMLVRAHYDGHEPWYNIAEARLDEGTLDKIPWDYTSLEYYYRRMKNEWPQIRNLFSAGVYTTARVFYIPQSDYWASVHVMGIAATNEVYESTTSMAGGKCSLIGSADTQVVGESRGWLPWSTFQFPMGRQDIIEDWYNPEGKKPRLRLRAFTGAANADVQVVLEELYKY